MRISTKGRYALRIMVDLAVHDDGSFIPLKDIAERQGITVKYLEQIVRFLQQAHFVKSHRGNSGGYRLARPSQSYTVGDILRTTEGTLAPVSCLDDEPNLCSRRETCITLPFWMGLHKVIGEYLDGTTLHELIEGKDGSTLTYCI